MILQDDFVHEYRGCQSDGGKCCIRIYTPSEQSIDNAVICSELPENDNTSIFDMAPYLIAELRDLYVLLRPLWIEHYPPGVRGNAEETFQLVTFGNPQDIEKLSALGDSDWHTEVVLLGGVARKRIKKEPNRMPLDRAEVEGLIANSV